jgi:hypothetical protein
VIGDVYLVDALAFGERSEFDHPGNVPGVPVI